MTRSAERAHAEAISELAKRLEVWGVDDPHERAGDYIRGLVWEGWRPRGPRYDPTVPDDVGHRCPAEAAPEDYRRAREALRRNPEPETTEEQADA